MTSSTPAARSRYALVLLTVLWVVACLALLWWLFTIGMEGWADQHSNGGGRSAEFGRRSARALLFWRRWQRADRPSSRWWRSAAGTVRTGLVYLFLAVVIAAALTPAVVDAARTLRPPAAPAPGADDLPGAQRR